MEKSPTNVAILKATPYSQLDFLETNVVTRRNYLCQSKHSVILSQWRLKNWMQEEFKKSKTRKESIWLRSFFQSSSLWALWYSSFATENSVKTSNNLRRTKTFLSLSLIRPRTPRSAPKPLFSILSLMIAIVQSPKTRPLSVSKNHRGLVPTPQFVNIETLM